MPDSIVIGTTIDSDDCSALRLRDVLRYVRRKAPVDMSAHAAVLCGWDRNLIRLARIEGRIGDLLEASGTPFVVSPAFSTWWEWSPFDSLVAMAMSANFASKLAGSVPTIPSVVWRHERDLVRWARWIAATGAEAIAVDLGTLRAGVEWTWGTSSLAFLAEQISLLGELPRLVAHGPSTLTRMAEVRRGWPGSLTFASQRPWLLAVNGRRLGSRLEVYPADDDQAVLARANRTTFAAVAHQVVSSSSASRKRAG